MRNTTTRWSPNIGTNVPRGRLRSPIFRKRTEPNKPRIFLFRTDYSYIDNEELLFAIRGMSLTASEQLLVYNASTESVQTVKVVPSEEASDEFEFEVDGSSL